MKEVIRRMQVYEQTQSLLTFLTRPIAFGTIDQQGIREQLHQKLL